MTSRLLQRNPRSFGRRQPFVGQAIAAWPSIINDDLKLFAMTYAAGFLVVSLFLA